jgi:hypothetical protein
VLDEDVVLHPLSLCQLVDEMQANPELFVATSKYLDYCLHREPQVPAT